MSDIPVAGPDPVPAGPDPAAATVGAAEPGQPSEAPGPARSRGRLAGAVLIQAITQGSSAVVTILAIFLALVVGGILIVFSDPVVSRAWSSFFAAPGYALGQTWDSVSFAYSQMFEGAILNPSTISAAAHGGSIAAIFEPLSSTCAQATPLILTGLSVAIAFRAGLFNIGAAGQWVGGAVVATWLGFGVSLPVVIHVIVCVVGAFIGGAVIGWFVGVLKARTGAHEVIVTIMLNYVMYDLLSYLLSHPAMLQQPGQTNQIAPFPESSANLGHVGGPPPQVGVGFLIAVAAALAVAWLLSRTTTGFQFRTVGASPSAARTAGINVERSWILVMLLAGGLAGLSAATVILGTNTQLTFNSYGTYGPDGITVALLGRAKPIGVVLAGLLFGALHVGGTYVEAATLGQVPADIVQVLEGLIVLFVAAPALIRAVFRLRSTAGTGMEAVAKGWNG
ncbi:MAG TPA: ABC transporter permease [Streptosporangiaceae bacterium]|nr:ABC transporter permease [Streptosporangiaceae bacterium]